MPLDAALLIDLMHGDEGAVERARALETDLIQQRLAATTPFESYDGVARAIDDEGERETIEAVIASKPIHPADAAVMRNAGSMAGERRDEGEPVDDGDAISGATADILAEPVLTRNVEDFERLNVEIETY